MAIITKQPIAPINPDERARTLSEAIKDPEAYKGIFQQAYENLGQPAQSVDPNENRLAVARSGTQELAEAFVDRYYEKTGKLPDPDQVSDFVGQNLSQGFAERIITGSQPRQSTISRLVDPFLEEIGAVKPKGTQETPLEDTALSKRIEELYGQVEKSGREGISRVFGQQRQRALEDEAAMPGRLRSGVSYARSAPTQLADEREAAALSDLIGGIAQQKAGGQFNLASQLANLGQQESQFSRSLGLERQQFRNLQEQQERDLSLQRQQLRLSELLGRLSGKGTGPSRTSRAIGGGASGALAGAATGAALAAPAGGIGAGAGALIGAGVGALGGTLPAFF